MIYKIDADAFITKGTAKLVTDLVNGCPKDEISNLTIEDVFTFRSKRTFNNAKTEWSRQFNTEDSRDSKY